MKSLRATNQFKVANRIAESSGERRRQASPWRMEEEREREIRRCDREARLRPGVKKKASAKLKGKKREREREAIRSEPRWEESCSVDESREHAGAASIAQKSGKHGPAQRKRGGCVQRLRWRRVYFVKQLIIPRECRRVLRRTRARRTRRTRNEPTRKNACDLACRR